MRHYFKAEGFLIFNMTYRFILVFGESMIPKLRKFLQYLVQMKWNKIYCDVVSFTTATWNFLANFPSNCRNFLLDGVYLVYLKTLFFALFHIAKDYFTDKLLPHFRRNAIIYIPSYLFSSHVWPFIFERLAVYYYLRAHDESKSERRKAEKILQDSFQTMRSIRTHHEVVQAPENNQRYVVVLPADVNDKLVQYQVCKSK